MNAKLFLLFVLSFYLSGFCGAAPLPPNRPGGPPPPGYRPPPTAPAREDPNAVLKQIRVTLSDLKNEVHNHETEIRMFEDRLQNQETTLDHLQQQIGEAIQSQSDTNKAIQVHLDGKIDSLDNTVRGLVADMRQMRNQANDYVQVLAQYKQKMSEMEKVIESQHQHMEVQNQHMRNLESALASIVEVLQAKEEAEKAIAAKQAESINKTYKVQPGDTLEKIARFHKVPLQTLREFNGLNNDRIIVGQTIKIP